MDSNPASTGFWFNINSDTYQSFLRRHDGLELDSNDSTWFGFDIGYANCRRVNARERMRVVGSALHVLEVVRYAG